ncbi:MAG: tetratricopeptide repeat protein [Gemmatimonadota bacterium]
MRLCTALLIAVVVVSCGGTARQPPRTTPDSRPSPTAESDDPRGATEEEPREISTDRALADDPGAGTPEREASLQVIEEGKGYLIAGRVGEAVRRFERATRIDPTNGFAYYYLGRGRIELGNPAGAVGILEKAESLLGPYPEWRERAATLLASVR